MNLDADDNGHLMLHKRPRHAAGKHIFRLTAWHGLYYDTSGTKWWQRQHRLQKLLLLLLLTT